MRGCSTVGERRMARHRSLRLIGLALTILAVSTPAAGMEYRVGGRIDAEDFPVPADGALARDACAGDTAAIVRGVRAGANPNGVGRDGGTPLFWALSCKNLRGMEALLRSGADPNYHLPGGPTAFSPVFAAAGLEDPAILALLLRYRGDPNSTGDGGATLALERAFSLGMELGHGGSDTNRRGWENYYALLAAGADINRGDKDGSIAEYAATMNQFDKVAELLDRGYDTRLENLMEIVEAAYLGPADTVQGPWRTKVKGMLKRRGVHEAP